MKETIVLYPTPHMGHIISMVELGKLILHHYSHRFSIIIFLLTHEILDNPGITSYINNISRNHPSISFLHFPPVSLDTTPNRSFAAIHFELIRLNAPHVLQSLKEVSKKGKISAFVIDIFCTSALSIAKDLNIPTCYFFTSGAACLAAFLYVPEIHEQHTESFKDLGDTTLHYPGIPPLKAIHMPEPMLDRNDPAYHDMIYFCSHLPKADGIIVNTFDDLEPKAVKTLATGMCVPHLPTPPIYYIGPLIADGGDRIQHDCLSWLDQQPRKSVVFLCFGSRGLFSVEQIKEIANGLERSGQRFLWVLKDPPNHIGEHKIKTDVTSDFDLDAVLPQGFVKRVEGKGMVVKSWAPQVTVLNHDSVGGFVTHCGWNSVLEAVVAGVPMVAWPLYAEQHLNRNILVEDMEMAIPVQQREEDGFVSGTELERRVRELMDSDKGKEMKERSWRMKERAVDSWGESGSSIAALAKLIKVWEQVGDFEE